MPDKSDTGSMTTEELIRRIKWLEAGIEVTTICVDVVTDEYDAFIGHHIAGTVDKKVLMRARATLPPRCANTIDRGKK